MSSNMKFFMSLCVTIVAIIVVIGIPILFWFFGAKETGFIVALAELVALTFPFVMSAVYNKMKSED